MSEEVLKERRRVTALEARTFVFRTIDKWEPKSQVWHFKYAGNASGLMGCLSATYITYHIRRELKLRHHARSTCYLPVAGMSCFLAEIFHDNLINTRLLSQQSCTLCLTTEAAILQVGMGVIYPLLLAPLIGFYSADKLLTYPVPSIKRAPRELFELWLKFVKRGGRPVVASAILQATVMAYFTHRKQQFIWDYLEVS